MSNPYQAVPVDQAENITQQLVTPMLKLTKFQVLDDGVKVDPTLTIQCLYYWQGIITALTMRMHSMTVLEYLMKIRSIDTVLIDNLQHDIQTADDNIAFLQEKLLQHGITL